jgi:hypothetical protein
LQTLISYRIQQFSDVAPPNIFRTSGGYWGKSPF